MINELIKKLEFNHKPVSLSNRFISNRVKEFDPDTATISGKSDDEIMYNCPFCEEVVGKVDTKGKLYFNTNKQIGHCFRCNTVAIIKSDKPINEIQLRTFIDSLYSKYHSRNYDYSSKLLNTIDLSKICNDLSDKGIDFINNRIPFYSEIAEPLNIKEVYDVGVLFPFYIDNKCISYSIRLFNPGTDMKYYIAKGIDKVPYSPTRILNDNKIDEVTIVEGCFDAIAAYLDGYPNPIALQGLFISDYMIYLLRRLNISKINIYLDDFQKSLDLKYSIRGKFPTVSNKDINIISSSGNDPEEIFKYRFIKSLKEDNKDYLNMVVERINKLKEMGNINET
jgi:hypothetical protein